MAEKQYIGQAKTRRVDYNGGSFVVYKVGVCLEQMGVDMSKQTLPSHIIKHNNGKHYFDFEMTEKRSVDEYGNSHSVYFTERPNPNGSGAGTAPQSSGTAPVAQSTAPRAQSTQSAPQPAVQADEQINPEDIPF